VLSLKVNIAISQKTKDGYRRAMLNLVQVWAMFRLTYGGKMRLVSEVEQ
jgi:hypothetical protein